MYILQMQKFRSPTLINSFLIKPNQSMLKTMLKTKDFIILNRDTELYLLLLTEI